MLVFELKEFFDRISGRVILSFGVVFVTALIVIIAILLFKYYKSKDKDNGEKK